MKIHLEARIVSMVDADHALSEDEQAEYDALPEAERQSWLEAFAREVAWDYADHDREIDSIIWFLSDG